MYQFTRDWFSSNAEQWPSIFAAAKWDPTRTKTVIEIGSFEGRSTIWILEHLLEDDLSRIHCIDTFEGGVEHSAGLTSGLINRFKANIAVTGQQNKVVVHQDKSWRALARLAIEGVEADFVYVDGSHQAPDVLEDMVLGFKMLKVGGVMICDDYIWDDRPFGGTGDLVMLPKIAVDSFTNIYSRKLRIFRNQRLYQLAFQKTAA